MKCAWPLRSTETCPARAAAPGEGREEVPETESAGAQEAERSFAGRDRSRSVPERRGGVEGKGVAGTDESRKARSVSAPKAVTNTKASVGFMDGKPRGLTSGVSGERSESAARRG